MWLWIGTGLGAFFALSVLVGAALAAMLGSIGRGVTGMHEELFAAAAAPAVHSRSRPQRRRLELELYP